MPQSSARSQNATPATVPVKPSTIRNGLTARTIYFPTGFLERIETRPGALVELLTLALTAYTKGGAQ